MSALWKKSRAFLSTRGGNFAIGMGLLGLPLAVAASMALDIYSIGRIRAQMQDAADAAVMSAALNAGSASVATLAGDTFQANIRSTAYGLQESLPAFSYLGQSADADGNPTVSGKATFAYSRLLPFGPQGGSGNDVAITVETRVTVPPGMPACLFALSRTEGRAVDVSGSALVDVKGCVVASNSQAGDALYVGGSGALSAECAISSGGIDDNGGLTTDCDWNRTNYMPSPDPLKDLPPPLPGVVFPDPAKADLTVQPGRYNNLTLDGTKTLQPGLYYVDGSLTIKGDITGDGVTFFLKDGAVTLNGGANLRIRPPTAGTYAGISFFGDPANLNTQKFTGNGTIDIDGFVYFPAGDVIYQGNSSTYSECLRIIADTVTMTGNSSMAADCSARLGGREALVVGTPYISG
ncbi:hypothetical protein CSC94_02295 [Zhengella mangrovi]|uniref:Uncharacterized protein n=1 Tax=Zhengella mangrovi TaxID=1982044 RepID=A0A2G1QTR6_9HYPH|nr:hypothetical protein [Zhengella mangrovi]PHP68844.1 hypothetical protein CSC94_02295 [Zhengella mangrovi]